MPESNKSQPSRPNPGPADRERPQHPTIAQVREVSQPPEVRGRKNSEHWVADVYLRRISPYLTRALLPTGVSANTVTWFMIVTGACTGFALLIPGIGGAALALLLGQLQMLWDCVDGEIARWRAKFSPAGIFLDTVGHYVAEALIPVCLGIRAAGTLDFGTPEQLSASAYSWSYMGALLALLIMFNKALNNMVHVSRAFSGLPRLADTAGVGTPTRQGLAKARALVRYFPFNRIYHSVEMTILAFIAAIVDLVAGNLAGTRVLVLAMLILAVPTIIGHMIAILTSPKLKVPDA